MNRHFLVVEQDPLIAMDLVEILSDCCVGASVYVTRTIEEAADCLSRASELTSAFFSVPTSKVLESGLDMKVASLGGRIVLVNGHQVAQDKRQEGWVFVPRPFTTAMIQDALVSSGALLR